MKARSVQTRRPLRSAFVSRRARRRPGGMSGRIYISRRRGSPETPGQRPRILLVSEQRRDQRQGGKRTGAPDVSRPGQRGMAVRERPLRRPSPRRGALVTYRLPLRMGCRCHALFAQGQQCRHLARLQPASFRRHVPPAVSLPVCVKSRIWQALLYLRRQIVTSPLRATGMNRSCTALP